jgi:hypothetical protein
MSAQVVAEQEITVGTPATIEGLSPSAYYGVVFEDDGTTAYLYALDFSREKQPIVDSLLIYNVEQVTDGEKPSLVQLVWSLDGRKAAVLINDRPHAVFDFEARRGYCRTNFPPPDRRWTEHGHEWDEKALDLFR